MIRQINGSSEIPSKCPAVVDFYATWCGPCKTFAPTYTRLATDFPNVAFLKTDIDTASELVDTYHITSVPTLIVFEHGKPIARMGNDPTRLVKILATLNDRYDK